MTDDTALVIDYIMDLIKDANKDFLDSSERKEFFKELILLMEKEYQFYEGAGADIIEEEDEHSERETSD